MGEWANWFPVVMLPLKLLVLGWGMFHAIKWHRDQAIIEKNAASNGSKDR